MTFTRLIVSAAILLGAANVAEALPVATTFGPVTAAPLVRVVGGCGYGKHRGPFGGCRLNRGPRGVLRALRTGAPRGCPPRRTRIHGICRFVS